MTICPYCNYHATDHEQLVDQGKQPKLDDLSFCINCGEVSKFSWEGLKKIKIDDLDEENKKEIKKIKEAWNKIKGFHIIK